MYFFITVVYVNPVGSRLNFLVGSKLNFEPTWV